LRVDDFALACVEISPEIINVGCGEDVTIDELARLIAEIVGFRGALVFDRSKPDGTPRKLLDVSKSRALGWQAKTALADGIRTTYGWYLANAAQDRAS
jgi:GDP-L-fucose synthase